MMIKFEINYPPCSINRAYRVGRGGNIYKTKEAKDWQETVFFMLPKATVKRKEMCKKSRG